MGKKKSSFSSLKLIITYSFPFVLCVFTQACCDLWLEDEVLHLFILTFFVCVFFSLFFNARYIFFIHNTHLFIYQVYIIGVKKNPSKFLFFIFRFYVFLNMSNNYFRTHKIDRPYIIYI